MVMVQDETETKEVELVRSVSKSEQQNPSFLSTAQRSDVTKQSPETQATLSVGKASISAFSTGIVTKDESDLKDSKNQTKHVSVVEQTTNEKMELPAAKLQETPVKET